MKCSRESRRGGGSQVVNAELGPGLGSLIPRLYISSYIINLVKVFFSYILIYGFNYQPTGNSSYFKTHTSTWSEISDTARALELETHTHGAKEETRTRSAKSNGNEKELKLERRTKLFKTQKQQFIRLLGYQKQVDSMCLCFQSRDARNKEMDLWTKTTASLDLKPTNCQTHIYLLCSP